MRLLLLGALLAEAAAFQLPSESFENDASWLSADRRLSEYGNTAFCTYPKYRSTVIDCPLAEPCAVGVSACDDGCDGRSRAGSPIYCDSSCDEYRCHTSTSAEDVDPDVIATKNDKRAIQLLPFTFLPMCCICGGFLLCMRYQQRNTQMRGRLLMNQSQGVGMTPAVHNVVTPTVVTPTVAKPIAQPTSQTMQLTVPAGMYGGQKMQASTPAGGLIEVQIPTELGPGATFLVTLPAAASVPEAVAASV